MRVMRAILSMLLCGMAAAPAAAQQPEPYDAQAVIDRMIALNPALSSFRTAVHVKIRMRSFPYLSSNLDGTFYFKRPDKYEVVFDRVPFYMRGFSRLFDDVADPGAWQRDENIVFLGSRKTGSQLLLLLRLTKKIHDDNLDHTDAYVDPASFEVVRMEWHYSNGGVIAMTQSYRTESGFTLLAGQHATIDIPYIHAVGTASYGAYQTNVDVNDAVFTGLR
jgi:hypothetical protein